MSNDKKCPLCGESNGCQAGTKNERNCWCNTTTIPRELLELIPNEQRMKSCICKKCVTRYLENPEGFTTSRV